MARTMQELREAARTSRARPIKDWDDPRLLPLIEQLHEYAQDKDWCATFDELAVTIGIPARPERKNIIVTRTATLTIEGQTFEISGTLVLYGYDEADAIDEYNRDNDDRFDQAMAQSIQLSARDHIVNALRKR